MKTKVLCLVLLTLGWLPSSVVFLAGVNLRWDHAVRHIVDTVASLLGAIILPGLGGFLAGWHWGGKGALLAGLYLLSSVVGMLVFFPVATQWNLIPPPSPEVWVEGPIGLLPVLSGVPGTVSAILGALAGSSLRRADKRSREDTLQSS
jgi:hypothetical protein